MTGWAAAAGIVGVSVLPGQYQLRTGAPSEVEHLAAYALVAWILVSAYPRRRWRILLFLMTLSTLLELAQVLVPGRTPRVQDVAISTFGAFVGLLADQFSRWLGEPSGASRIRRPQETASMCPDP